MMQGVSFKEEIKELIVVLVNCADSAERCDRDNYSASSELTRSLRHAEKMLQDIRGQLRAHRSTLRKSRSKSTKQ